MTYLEAAIGDIVVLGNKIIHTIHEHTIIMYIVLAVSIATMAMFMNTVTAFDVSPVMITMWMIRHQGLLNARIRAIKLIIDIVRRFIIEGGLSSVVGGVIGAFIKDNEILD